MADKLKFELVSPERVLASLEADMVVVPGGEGHFGVQPEHAPFMSTVRPGVIDVHQLDVRVTELMTGNPVSVGPETDIDEVIEVMIDNRVGAVPVVTGDELVGLVSYVDVLRAAIGKL